VLLLLFFFALQWRYNFQKWLTALHLIFGFSFYFFWGLSRLPLLPEFCFPFAVSIAVGSSLGVE
jgi:hypothetical protein